MNRIAIYSRKSIFTGKGESVENQIQLCKNYCQTYMDSNSLNYTVYEDDGFSGKNTNRPKFIELINDIKSKRIDTLICYRIDRISRNVSDFSSILELLQEYNVTFISLKEHFDTSTPMGRAMIYIASVFAQLERETIAERVKDNMLELAKMGKWSGGQLPLGFLSERFFYIDNDLKEKSFVKLVPIEEELDIVNFIYKNYLLYGSISNIVRELNIRGIKSKHGADFDLSVVKRALKNSLYVKSDNEVHNFLKDKGLNVYGEPNGNGYITYNKFNKDINEWIVAVSSHKGIIDSKSWIKVQKMLDNNKIAFTSSRSGTSSNNSLFSGILKCKKCGSPMVIKYNNKNKEGKSLVYYICNNKVKSGINKCDCSSLRTDIIDDMLIKQIKFYNKEIIMDVYNKQYKKFSRKFNENINLDLENNILKKRNQANNLIVQLSNTTNIEVSKMIMDKINDINDEITDIENRINSVVNKNIDISSFNNDDLTCYFKKFDKYLGSINDINVKRLIIKNMIKEIVYDSDNKSFSIKFHS